MNNQYKYFGQHLTARMSRELIQELFAGQTVQRQEIIRAVDEAHLERGGLLKRSIAHPVGSALSVMKADGLAESPEYGVWSILSETIDMNNRYRYFEQVLTPGIAQELIQELFEGQTAQKQEIANAVDNAHLERGGLASEDPVTTALTALKRSGLAENPEGNIWSILIETPDGSHIKTLNEFINWTAQFKPKDYVFRGVPNETYRIQASAYRRPKEDDRNFKKFLEINKGLIEEAALRGYDEDKRNGRELKHLEILAELQHFGAATCLIDFTYNALVALWFACQPDSKTQDSERQPNGKVFAVFNKPPRFTKIESASLSWTIDRFLQDSDNPQLYHWQPRQQNNRIIAQQSIFLLGDYEFDADGECIIAKKSKESILDELEQASGITEAMLFPDFDGFAWLRREGIQYKQLLDYEYRERAHKRFQDKKYEEAITDYDMAIDLDPDYAEAYYHRGLAKQSLEQYEEAIKDYDDAIRINSDYAEVYYQRAEANSSLGHLVEARADLQTALELADQANDERLIELIQELLYEINSRTVGGSEDE